VTVLSPDIDHVFYHSDRLEKDEKNSHGGYYSFKGTLLPYQGVEIRWWRKTDLAQQTTTRDI